MSNSFVPEVAVEEENPAVNMDLMEYITALGEAMMLEPPLDNAALAEALDEIQTNIQEIRNFFVQEPPSSLENIKNFMLESLDLYTQSIDDMRTFIETNEYELLERAMVHSGEAEEIILAMDQVIEEQRNMLRNEEDVS